MRILAIDTSTQSGGVAVMDDNSVLSSVFELAKNENHGSHVPHASEEFSSRLFRYVDSALTRVGLTLPEIDIFAVTAGPGSFTGLRVGLTAVKAWSEVYGKPIAAISGLEAIAAQSRAADGADSSLIAAFTDARRGQIYGAVFERRDGRLHSHSPEVVARPEEFIDLVIRAAEGKQVRFVSPSTEILQEAIGASALRDSSIEKVLDDLAPWVGRLAFDRAQRGELVDALTLDANYVRRMDAELYWKDS
jgi:tRNA threonylcarbamoyladenosine biosynthesis protein TsaB